MIKKCKICLLSKEASIKYRYADGRSIFCNRLGNLWRGQTCPECFKLDRSKKLNSNLTNRICRGCNKQLPKNRYFHCVSCKGDLGDDLTEEQNRRLGPTIRRDVSYVY